ncbi:geranylgeranyl transferase type-2 subunit alpha [Phlyctema vagabunda]|uniref:Geranylgeranyl transferase type-2 subunit alpha n=1 Tax=Phlyctema vagabunda TaxID=108571 RepID=A0ABR4PQ46_9HELO
MASHGVSRPATTTTKDEQAHLKEQKDIQEYKALVDLVEAKVAERQYTIEVLELTSKLLTRNPEYYTVWNVRRRLLTYGLFSKSSASSSPSTGLPNTSQTDTITTSSDDSSSSSSKTTLQSLSSQTIGKNGTTLDILKEELAFLVPLLLGWPKCYWIWNYRLWLLQQAKEKLEVEAARAIWTQELGLVGKMLTRDNRNFHGWGYRRKIVATLEGTDLNGTSMAETEFQYTTKMFSASLSNFSALHTRSKLIPKILDERKTDDAARRKFLDDEFELIERALWTDASNQSAWFYHEFLMTNLLEPVNQSTITPNLAEPECIDYIVRQIESIKDMLDGEEDCKWIYNALLGYTKGMWQLEGRQPTDEEKSDCQGWLKELCRLDPLRNGRWNELEKELNF